MHGGLVMKKIVLKVDKPSFDHSLQKRNHAVGDAQCFTSKSQKCSTPYINRM